MRHLSAVACGCVLFAALVSAAIPANAQRSRSNHAIEPPSVAKATTDRPEVFGSVTVFSDQRSQGFTANDGDPVVQVDAGVIWKRFYFGLSASNVDLGDIVTTTPPSTRSIGHAAISYYGGYVGSFRSIDWDVSVSYATYPGARDSGAELDYWEFSVGAAKVMFHDIRSGVRIYWSPEYTGDQGHNWVIETSTQKPLPAFRGIEPTLEFVSGYQFGDEGRGNFDYYFWELGLEFRFNQHLSVDLRYHDTVDVPIDCNDLCDGRFVVSLTAEF